DRAPKYHGSSPRDHLCHTWPNSSIAGGFVIYPANGFSTGGKRDRAMTYNRRVAMGAAISLMLIGSGIASAQPAPPAAPAPTAAQPKFHERVEELARALQNNPRLRNLSEQERLNRLEFVIGNTLFALLHEMGHVAIDEMKLPVLGREEDEADAFATLRLLKVGSDFSQRVLAEAAKNWFLSARRDEETGA